MSTGRSTLSGTVWTPGETDPLYNAMVYVPTECSTDPLTAQEKVLMFMLFDLASCVQTPSTAPIPPIIK